jgi:hypothetical protein
LWIFSLLSGYGFILSVCVFVLLLLLLLLLLFNIWISVRHLWFMEGALPPHKLVAVLCEQYDSESKDGMCHQASCVYE